jgi:cation:H+ antiporter
MLLGLVLLAAGIALIVWGAEWFTDGALRTAAVMAMSPFAVGLVVSGLEPENLTTGVIAALERLPQIALGTVIGAAIFLLTAALGVSLLLVPMAIRIPRAAGGAMLASAAAFALSIWDGHVTRVEGAGLLGLAVGLLIWLYRASPVFLQAERDGDGETEGPAPSRVKAIGLLAAGVAALLVGAEGIVRGVTTLMSTVKLSETFLGMAVVGMGESLEEAARMVSAARRGHPELAWGNVVGTVVILLGVNLGLVALVQPLVADPLVVRLHAPYLVGCILLVGGALGVAKELGRRMGSLLVVLYLVYLALNLRYLWA